MKFIKHMVLTGIGLGLSPFAPGTVASAATVVAHYFIPHFWPIELGLILLLFFVGVHLSAEQEKISGVHDPSWIVVDEIVGMWCVLVGLQTNPLVYLFALIFFRFFDISKWFGVGYFEQFKLGWGVMLDDILAAVYARILLFVVLCQIVI